MVYSLLSLICCVLIGRQRAGIVQPAGRSGLCSAGGVSGRPSKGVLVATLYWVLLMHCMLARGWQSWSGLRRVRISAGRSDGTTETPQVVLLSLFGLSADIVASFRTVFGGNHISLKIKPSSESSGKGQQREVPSVHAVPAAISKHVNPLEQPNLAEQLAAVSIEQQKQMLGEKLYPGIAKHPAVPAGLVGKVTGMLLDMDVSELVSLYEAPDALHAKVIEAIDVLVAHGMTATVECAADAPPPY